jgi:hypothetical protein
LIDVEFIFASKYRKQPQPHMAPSRAPKLLQKPSAKQQIENDLEEDLEASSPSILDTGEGGNIDSDIDSQITTDEESSDVSPIVAVARIIDLD